jgi:hypothetical protein
MNDTYWQIWIQRDKKTWLVYHSDIPLKSIQFQGAIATKLIKLVNTNHTFVEKDYIRYIKLLQRKWKRIQYIRKHALKYLRLREIGIHYPLG